MTADGSCGEERFWMKGWLGREVSKAYCEYDWLSSASVYHKKGFVDVLIKTWLHTLCEEKADTLI